MTLSEKYGKTALIAGGSEGLGAAFARLLADQGIDLVLIARRREPLEKIAAEIRNSCNVNVDIICCDLASGDVMKLVSESLAGREINILVYNAALSHIGRFEEDSPEHILDIAGANMITLLEMTRHFGNEMLRRKRGAIILMSSLAGFQGSGFLSEYAATKAFSRILAEGLWYEWKNRGVDIITCCAGATSTEKYLLTNPGKSGFFAPRVQTPHEVAEECLKHLGKVPSFISGRGNRVASFFMQRIMPRRMAINIMGNTTKKIYRIK